MADILAILQDQNPRTPDRVEGPDDLFTMDDKSYAIAEGRLEIFNPLYLIARAEQRWVDEDQDGAFEQAEPEVYFGLEFSANF